MKHTERLGPQDKLFAAISILQAHILAEDSTSGKSMFGVNHFKTSALELAESLLQDVTPYLDNIEDKNLEDTK